MDLCWDAIADPSSTTMVTGCLALLPTMAGLGLILHLRTGRILTLIAQGVQLIGFASPTFTWIMNLGISSRLQINVIASDVPGESYFGVAGHVFHGKEAHLAIGHPHPDFEGYVFSFNFLALVIMITVWFMFRPGKLRGGTADG